MAENQTLTRINVFESVASYEANKTSIADNEISLVKISAVLMETWSDGTSWYRKWSDGWIEQGGSINIPDVWTITFPVPFETNNYVLQGEAWNTDSTANLGILSKNPAYASGNILGSSGCRVEWYACGY